MRGFLAPYCSLTFSLFLLCVSLRKISNFPAAPRPRARCICCQYAPVLDTSHFQEIQSS